MSLSVKIPFMRMILTLLLVLLIGASDVAASTETPTPPGPWQNLPKLDAPAGRVVRVRSEPELQAAVRGLRSNTTILIAPGTYRLTNTLQIQGGVTNVALRGAAADRTSVVLRGRGMSQKDFGGVPHGISVAHASDVLLANFSVGDVWFHPITLQGQFGCKRVRMFNLRLFDAGEQFLKSNPGKDGHGADDCTVEHCVFEFSDTSRHWYTQGMSVHGVSNWVVRNNLFRNIRGPKHDPNVGPCIDFWKGSRNTLVEGNVLVDCRMGIRFGVFNTGKVKGVHDHEGGIIRNNLIWRQPDAVLNPDGGILVWDSPGTKILHNTVILNGTYTNGAIEYRWSDDIVVANNLTDARIWKREEASGKEANNVVIKDYEIFKDAAAANLHLAPKASLLLHQVPVLPDCRLDSEGKKRGDSTDVGACERVPIRP
jgi:hypothetical protein